jgi:hypothetical protein
VSVCNVYAMYNWQLSHLRLPVVSVCNVYAMYNLKLAASKVGCVVSVCNVYAMYNSI